jgi:hypothetical protein
MSENFIERRTYARHRVFKGGVLAFGSGSVECTVRNISPGGARVDLASPMRLPESFTLLIASEHLTRRCHPVWTQARHIGVAFD